MNQKIKVTQQIYIYKYNVKSLRTFVNTILLNHSVYVTYNIPKGRWISVNLLLNTVTIWSSLQIWLILYFYLLQKEEENKKKLSNTDSGIKNECFLSRFSNFRNFENEIKSLNICEKHC